MKVGPVFTVRLLLTTQQGKPRLVEIVITPSLSTNPLLGAAALDDLPQFQIAGWKGHKTLFMSCELPDEDLSVRAFQTTVVARSHPQP